MLIELVLGLVLQEKAPAKDGGQGPMLQVAEVDTNGDGWISAAELKAALAKLGGGGEKKDGFKKPGGEGDGVKKPFKGEGEGVKKPGVKEGEGAKKPGPKDGEAPVKKGPKDGEGERKEGEKDQK